MVVVHKQSRDGSYILAEEDGTVSTLCFTEFRVIPYYTRAGLSFKLEDFVSQEDLHKVDEELRREEFLLETMNHEERLQEMVPNPLPLPLPPLCHVPSDNGLVEHGESGELEITNGWNDAVMVPERQNHQVPKEWECVLNYPRDSGTPESEESFSRDLD
jgi:hypothetical protein